MKNTIITLYDEGITFLCSFEPNLDNLTVKLIYEEVNSSFTNLEKLLGANLEKTQLFINELYSTLEIEKSYILWLRDR